MTPVTKRSLLSALGGLAAAAGLPQSSNAGTPDPQIAPGPFKPNWNSLISGYQAPDWYRDAKFGIWAHWGAQSFPERGGGWYAREMYEQSREAYAHHLKTFGHPSDTGYMDLLPKWKAENWQPDLLVQKYKAAGAKFFVALATHHDNFDNFNSKYHAWNSVAIGPKRDLIGDWAAAAKKADVRFGISSHNAPSWHWFQTAYGYDATGPRAGERYDAYNLTKADGSGKWWDGLDPAELYGTAGLMLPDGFERPEDILAFNRLAWHRLIDEAWTDGGPKPTPQYVRNWYLRTKDVIDSYHPDFIFFDNKNLPLGQAGLDIAAHFYNSSIQWHGGKLDAVVTGNFLPPDRQAGMVLNTERGLFPDILPHAWNACSCIGGWFYSRDIYETKTYKTAKTVINNLTDIVAKNGTYLLSVPIRGDGTIDDEEEKVLAGVQAWMQKYSEAIYDTRPWKIAGEGITQVTSGLNSETNIKAFTGRDIRFTTKSDALYAITMGATVAKTVTIVTLSTNSPLTKGAIKRVELVGQGDSLQFTRDEKGLHVAIGDIAIDDIGIALKIHGRGLV